MKNIDIQFTDDTMKILNQMIGKTLNSIKHDTFQYANTSSQLVSIMVDNEEYYLYSFTEPKDYYGSKEDVAVWTFTNERYPIADIKDQETTPINEVIKRIIVVNENQQLFKDNIQTYDVNLTRGLIFDLGDRQISFEKAVWFSEDIYINKGYDLIDKFQSVEEFENKDNWVNGITAKSSRNTVKIE